jgi:hypothetical protein
VAEGSASSFVRPFVTSAPVPLHQEITMTRVIALLTFVAAAALAATPIVSTQTPSPWDVSRATLVDNASPTNTAIGLMRGVAFRPDLSMRDGTIEFQLSAAHGGFAGLAFRMASTSDYEIIYFAPSDDGTRWKYVQYQPVFQGETTWQLYYRDEYRADLPKSATGAIHVRLAISGTRADVYVNDLATPVLRIHDLKRDPASGAVGVWAASPKAATTPIEFSQLSTNTATPSLAAVAPEHAPETQILQWQVSPRQPSPGEVDPPAQLPLLDFARMPVITAEPSGLVNLTRALGNPAGPQTTNVFGGAGWGLAYAHVTIEAEAPRITRLFVSYSDGIGVYLNGERRFTGNNVQDAREPGANGTVQTEVDGIDLPLRRGRNELVLAITDKAFGWGFRARLETRQGLTIHP